MGRTTCCKRGYTTRSYNLDGSTNWTRNYWEGSAGNPTAGSLRCAIDSEGNVYVAGDCAQSATSSATWSLISYDPDGVERWRKDIRKSLRDVHPIYATFTGNMWDVVCLPDDRICVIGDAADYTAHLINQWSSFWFNPDGSEATRGSVAWAAYNRLQHIELGVVNNTIYGRPRGPTTWGGASTNAFCARGTGVDSSISDTGFNAFTGFTYASPTILQISNGRTMSQTFPNLWDWGFWGTQHGVGYNFGFASTNTLASSPDGSCVYASTPEMHGIYGGLGITFTVARLVPDIGYVQSRGVGQTPFAGDPPVFNYPNGGGADSIIWGLGASMGDSQTPCYESVGVEGGVVMAGTPRLKFFAEDDGSKVWAHQHQQISGLAYKDGRLITTGDYQLPESDASFV